MNLKEKLTKLNELRNLMVNLESDIRRTTETLEGGQQSVGIRINNEFISLDKGETARITHCIEGIFNDRLANLTHKLQEVQTEAEGYLQ